MSATVVSSPGKVLLAGGYLVLDPAYSGVVVSTSSRFYTVVRTGTSNEIHVRSPQFVEGSWSYTVKLAETSVQVEPSPSIPGKNKFVHFALQNALTLALEVNGAAQFSQSFGTGLDITIAGDNDFYSQEDQLKKLNLPSNIESLSKIPPFSHTGVTLADVAKTGLGSSAALITSLVTALLVHFAVLPRALDAPARLLAHNVAQFVHCLAQGKVGSGFDVSAAAFGSQLYTRFSPEVIKPLMDGTAGTQPLFPTLSPQNPAWDYRVEPFQLPPFTRLLLADIHAGSNTPSLVGKVLKWREQDSTTGARSALALEG
ncbi:hypothetical protein EWM64_g10166 [Hericium alpestre]|uniref:phosphomevalonate kinase n=1 Tax=Hericium alpestre TaxID=135208 RepID=A0A4Y9ZIJ3_9AGAM|nr:hypothetical protein EWM64_g10166 [Hericium alpestre]